MKGPIPGLDESRKYPNGPTTENASFSDMVNPGPDLKSSSFSGIRTSLILVMAGLLFIFLLVAFYSFWTLDRTRHTMTDLVSEDLPDLVLAQSLSDEFSSLGDSMQTVHFGINERERLNRILDLAKRIDYLQVQMAVRLKEIDRAPLQEETAQRLRDMKKELDEVSQKLSRYNQSVEKIIVAQERKEALSRLLEEAFDNYDLVLDNANRQMRALVARALAADIPDSAALNQLNNRLDTFLEREMSWLGTAQDLRTNAREMRMLVDRVMRETEPPVLDRLSQRIPDVLLSMALYKHLPGTTVTQALAAQTENLTRQFAKKPEESLFSVRKAELEEQKTLALSFKDLEGDLKHLRRDSVSLVKMLSDRTEVAVQGTSRRVHSSKQFLLAFTVLAALGSIFLIRYFVLRKIVKRVEGLTRIMRQAATKTLRGQETRFDEQMKIITRGDGRDEIAAMGESLIVFIEAIAQRDRERALADHASKEALLQSEKQLRQIIDLVPHFIFAKDAEGRFFLANRAMAEGYGTTVNELTGKTDADFAASEEEAQKFCEEDLGVISSGQPKVVADQKFTDASGRVRHLTTTKIPFRFSEESLVSVLGVSVDITERKQAEDLLTQSEEHFRSLIENSSDVILEIDKNRRISYVSPSIEHVLGYKPKSITDKMIFEFIHPDDSQRAMEAVISMLQNPGVVQKAEYRLGHFDGSWRVFQVIGKSNLDDSGNIRIIINCRDITELSILPMLSRMW